jgi:hypothetical protein
VEIITKKGKWVEETYGISLGYNEGGAGWGKYTG